MAKDIGTILEEAAVVRDETLKEANTADRVGGVLADIAEYVRGSTFAQGVTIEASASAVTIRLKRADESGTSYYENVTLPAVSSSKAGVMTPTQVATLLQHTALINSQSKKIETVSSAVETNTAAIATNASGIQTNADAIATLTTSDETNKKNIANNGELIDYALDNIDALELKMQRCFKDLGTFETSSEGESAMASWQNVFGSTCVFMTYKAQKPNARTAFSFQTINGATAYQCLFLAGKWYHRNIFASENKQTVVSAWEEGIS